MFQLRPYTTLTKHISSVYSMEQKGSLEAEKYKIISLGLFLDLNLVQQKSKAKQFYE